MSKVVSLAVLWVDHPRPAKAIWKNSDTQKNAIGATFCRQDWVVRHL